MGNLKSIDFERCTSGIEFEGWVCDLLRKLSFTADRVGKNDSGVDIIMRAKWNDKVYRFYIQCKYYNKPIGKTPVHEVFAGTAFHKDYGRPVVIVNNTMTYEARRYAKELGVEIIAEPEWAEFEDIIKNGAVSNPNDKRAAEGLKKQAQGNAIERLGKNLTGIKAMMNHEGITPFVCFGHGCDFDEGSKILARVSTMNEFYDLNKIYIFKRDGDRDQNTYAPTSMFFRLEKWTIEDIEFYNCRR